MPTVLITREHAAPLSDLLADRGVESVHVPMLQLVGTGARAPDGQPDHVLVTSAAAVRFATGLSDAVSKGRVVAVGPATARALEGAGVRVHAVGQSGGVDALDLVPHGSGSVWYIGAREPSPGLDAALAARGLTRWAVYRAMKRPVTVADGGLDALVFTSGRTIEAYVEANGLPQLPVAVLGPSTRAAAERLSIQVDACAARPTLDALADAVAELV